MKFTKMKPFKLFMEYHNNHVPKVILVKSIERGLKEIDKGGSVEVEIKTTIPTIPLKSPIPTANSF